MGQHEPSGSPAAGAMAGDHGRPAPPPEPGLVGELVIANQILFRHGVVDAFGHVSVRHDKQPERFLMSRNLAPALVTAEDIVEFSLDGGPVNAGGRPVYLERFIHGEIYRARPDVGAVVHSHAPGVVPFSVVPEVPLRPVWHMSGFLAGGPPVFEIRDVAGEDSNLLISSNALGESLARTLGAGKLVLMRGHGMTVAAENLRLVVFRSVYTQINAELQLRAMQLGPVTYLSPGEAEATTVTNSGQVDRAWNLWRLQAEKRHGVA